MPRVTVFNRVGEMLSYKMNINATGSGPGRVIPIGESDGPHGDYAAGTTITLWWRRGDVLVKTCNEPGCNGQRFQVNDTNIGVYLGQDARFKEQEPGLGPD